MINNIAISSMAFPNMPIEEIIKITSANNWSLEFSSGLQYVPGMIDVFLNASVKKYIHNYFPAPEIPFVLNLASSNPTIRKNSIEHSKQGLRLAQQGQCGFYSVHAGFCIDPKEEELGKVFENKSTFNRAGNFKLFKSSLFELLDYADSLDVCLLVENNVVIKENIEHHGQNPFFCSDPVEINQVIQEINHPRLGLLLDTGHLKVSSQTLGFDLDVAVLKMKNFIGAIHHSDNNGLRDTNNTVSNKYWFLEHLKWFKKIPHVLEFKPNSIEDISCQVTLFKSNLFQNLSNQ